MIKHMIHPLIKHKPYQRAFTLVELLVVITIAGILAGMLTVFLRPAIDAYLDTRNRADLTDMADTALRRIALDVRNAVPNSVIVHNPTCFQFVPTIAGGRYRMAPDTVNGNSQPLDTSGPTGVFDILSPLAVNPQVGDWVVINNQNTNDVYQQLNRSAITNIAAPPVATAGQLRLTVNNFQFPTGYDGGRFVIVPNASQSVFYHQVGTTLRRTVANFNAGIATCNQNNGDILADAVNGVIFIYNPNQGATQQSGFIWMQINFTQGGQNAALAYGVHVSNLP